MLPPEPCLPVSGAKSGPACPCIQKPLPCLMDQWVNGPSVPFEQPLSIQTDMEYTLDTRMFPGWDPVTGKTEPALVIDTAALALTGANAVGAATPVMSSPVSSVSSPVHRTPPRNNTSVCGSITTTPTSHHQNHYRTSAVCRTRHQHQLAAAAAARASGAWTPASTGQVVPATPGQVPALPHGHAASYHPAFRPTDPQYRQPSQFAHHHLRAVTQLPCETLHDHDIMSLIASFDAEPSGYSLDVDWLIGQTSPSHSTNHVDFTGPSKRDLVINASLNNPRHLQQQQQQQQRPPHPPQARGSTTNPNLPPSTTISTPSSTATTTDLRTIAYGMFHPQHHHHHHLHPHPHHHLPDSATLGRNDLLSYQSQFYPGATLQPVKTGSAAAPHPQQQQQQLAAPAAVMVPAPYAPLQTRSRPVKRRLPVDSPCEGTLPGNYHPHHLASHHNPLTAASLDVTVSKRARWSLTMNPHDLGLHAHVPSPLQARAY